MIVVEVMLSACQQRISPSSPQGFLPAPVPPSTALSSTPQYTFKLEIPNKLNNAFSGPQKVLVNSQGDIYVLSTGDSTITLLNALGQFVTQWGGYGTGAGQMEDPYDMAIGLNGNIYVADTDNSRIEKFNPNGGLIWTVSATTVPTLDYPTALTVDSSGNIFIENFDNGVVDVLTNAGNYLTSWIAANGNGAYGIAVGYLNGQETLDIGVWSTRAIEEYSYPQKALLSNSINTGASYLTQIATDAQDDIYVADYYNGISEFNSSGTKIRSLVNSIAGTWGVFQHGYDLWTTNYQANEVIEYNLMNGSSITFTGQVPTMAPTFLASNISDVLYVSDDNSDDIQEFNGQGDWIGSIGMHIIGIPMGIAVSAGDNLYVVDSEKKEIEKFNALHGNLLLQWPLPSPNGDSPIGIATNGHGVVYVTDAAQGQILRFTSQGDYLGSWVGTGNFQLEQPTGILVTAHGNIYVADAARNVVEEFSPSGVVLNQWGASGTSLGELNDPQGIVMDERGNIFVVDHGNDRIDEFDRLGKYEASFGGVALAEGSLGSSSIYGYPNGILGIAINSLGDIFVGDHDSGSIKVFSPL